MSTLNPTYFPLSSGLGGVAGGPESKVLARLTRRALDQLRHQAQSSVPLNDLYDLLSEFEEDANTKADLTTFETGKRFLLAFPTALPPPELSLDSDGELSFDWIGNHHRIFSVSLRADGRLSFAGKLGVKRTVYGTETFYDMVPQRVLDSVKALFSD